MEALLRDMQKRAKSHLMFPSPFNPNKQRNASAIRHRLTAACRALGLAHMTPHGMRSYFVTRARESGLSDAEIAMLIGDRSGPAIIAHTYGDVRPDHLRKQAQRIRLTVQTRQKGVESSRSPNSIPVCQLGAPCVTPIPQAAEAGM
jgi:integrase